MTKVSVSCTIHVKEEFDGQGLGKNQGADAGVIGICLECEEG